MGLEADGVKDPPDEQTMLGALCHFEDRHFVVRAPDYSALIEGDSELDLSTHPKSITWIDSIGADATMRPRAINQARQPAACAAG